MTFKNHTLSIFLLLLLLINSNTYSQSTEAIISFKTKYLKNHKINFIINGLKIIPNKEKHKIEINKTDYDTLVCLKNDKKYSLSLLKFKENIEYIITINPCGFYDIQPINSPKKGVVRYNYISKVNDSVNAILDLYSQPISSNKNTNYYSFIPSAMCAFTKKKISLIDSKSEKELSSIYFNFLHGEKLTYIYNEKTKKQCLIFDGYIKEDEKYSIMEMIN
ncbi:hypothetical protein L1265_04830 [Tenacibaculum sp. Cn5-1]|uniref:hypothetical protein n=1 Tax=unclassified Tenacibaculum TaxID=2635139 RepID=UPI001EF99DDA|nr:MULTISPECIES: hypothetical protein [unclassified Tenacibaculum]MCF2874010.1 hypothetical protein [Tenacibaculum sp. Cn5-1]